MAPDGDPKTAKPHYHGHRERLRERFRANPDALPDYEILELLLMAAIPRSDVKPLAKALLGRFGTLGAVLAADPRDLTSFDKLGDMAAVTLKAMHQATLRGLRAELKESILIDRWDRLLDYCHTAMAHGKTEQFRLLFLDRKNRLIADEVQQQGTVDHAPVYPREVVKRALELGASALILVHNHPSGDPEPSRADIEMTRNIVDAARPLGLVVHDHLVVGREGTRSFKSMGLL